MTSSNAKPLISPIEYLPRRPDGTPIIKPIEYVEKPFCPIEYIADAPAPNKDILNKVDPAAVSLFSLDKAQPKETSSQKDKAVETKVVIEDSAYKTAQRLIKSVTFACVNDALYHFDTPIFRLLTPSKLHKLIVDKCRIEIENSGSPRFVKDVREFIEMEPSIERTPCDAEDYLVFKNGVLNIWTGAFTPPSSKIFATSYINIDYRPVYDSLCPNFDTFVATIANSNELLIDRIWEAVGYYVTTDMRAKKFLLLQGVGDSGKSQLGAFLVSLFSDDACASIDLYRLGDRFSLSGLVGKRINASMDLPSGTLNRQAVSIVKQLTGGDMMTAEAKYQNPFRFKNTCKLIFASNHPLTLSEDDEAFENRVLVIPFKHAVAKNKQDPHLLEKFECEKLAIVMKALEFYRSLVKRNYAFSGDFDSCVQIGNTTPVFNVQETVSDFVGECCSFDDPTHRTLTSALHERYRAFCYEHEIPPISDRSQFSIALKRVCGGKNSNHSLA